MSKPRFLLTFFLLSAVISCGPSQRVTSSWLNPEVRERPYYKKIFIAALVQNPSYKGIIEQDLAKAAQSMRMDYLKSSELFQPNFTADNVPVDKSVILEKVRKSGCDAIFTVALVDKSSETHYVPGSTAFAPYGGYGGLGFGGYYGHMYPAMYSTPGYYATDRTYFMEAHVFDAATEKMVWAAQSQANSPSKITSFSREYSAILLQRMERDIKDRFKK